MIVGEETCINAGAAGLAALYAAGRTDPVRVVEMYLDRIARIDPAIGAYVHVAGDEARETARRSAARFVAARRGEGRPLSPLDGVPLAVKANIALAGAPWHAGIGAYRHRIAEHDAACVAVLKAAGAVILGLVNMHEGALGATTDNPWFGRTQNPLRPGWTAGGSSGGSGAVVAAGLAAAALGTDTMGSVRIPSAYCGLAGYKPGFGVIPTDGVVPLSTTLDHVGSHGRSVADCALVAAVAAGRGDLMPPFGTTLSGRSITIGRMPVLRRRVDAAGGVWAAEDAAAARLAAAGVRFVDLDPGDYDPGALRRQGLLLSEVEGRAVHSAMLERDPDGFGAEFRALLDWGARQLPSKVATARDAVRAAGERLRHLLAGVDAVLMPTAPQTAFPFGDPVPANQADFTAMADFAGCAAVCVPAGAASNGMPLSVQVMGLEEATVLAVASLLE
ncbi:MAG: hypothetical protein RLY86_1017 [Pseudomonadota bacterium]|jgi:aspartyl-tRNA(Asn)/glutamyl-tRNA(Gln) amidotransferase subunit A